MRATGTLGGAARAACEWHVGVRQQARRPNLTQALLGVRYFELRLDRPPSTAQGTHGRHEPPVNHEQSLKKRGTRPARTIALVIGIAIFQLEIVLVRSTSTTPATLHKLFSMHSSLALALFVGALLGVSHLAVGASLRSKAGT